MPGSSIRLDHTDDRTIPLRHWRTGYISSDYEDVFAFLFLVVRVALVF